MIARFRHWSGKELSSLLWHTIRALALVVYTALLAEAFVRLSDPQPVMPRYVTGTAWGVRGNIPNARYWHHTPEVDVEYRVNSQGLRADREYPTNKPPGVCRVALFGDSIFFGYEVDLQDSFAGQLENRLKEHGIPAEVLNFAVSGFGTAEMLQTYESYGRHFDPDVTIFSWSQTDPSDNVRSDLYELKYGQLVRVNAEYLPSVKFQDMLMRYRLYRLINDNSQFYAFARESISIALKNRLEFARIASLTSLGRTGDGPASVNGDSDILDSWHRIAKDLSSALVLRAHDVVVADGGDFYLVEFPERVTRTQIAPTIDSLSTAALSRIKVISAIADLSDAARPDLKLFYEKGEGHLTPIGIRVMVDKTVRVLSASPQLAACAQRSRTVLKTSNVR